MNGCVELGTVRTFVIASSDREQAEKILEEAAEVFSQVERMQEFRMSDAFPRVLEECADVVQATCNLVTRLGASDIFKKHLDAVERKNASRGRYGEVSTDGREA